MGVATRHLQKEGNYHWTCTIYYRQSGCWNPEPSITKKKADRIAWGRPKDGKELFGDFSTALRKHIATIDVILAELMLISGQFQMQKPKTKIRCCSDVWHQRHGSWSSECTFWTVKTVFRFLQSWELRNSLCLLLLCLLFLLSFGSCCCHQRGDLVHPGAIPKIL